MYPCPTVGFIVSIYCAYLSSDMYTTFRTPSTHTHHTRERGAAEIFQVQATFHLPGYFAGRRGVQQREKFPVGVCLGESFSTLSHNPTIATNSVEGGPNFLSVFLEFLLQGHPKELAPHRSSWLIGGNPFKHKLNKGILLSREEQRVITSKRKVHKQTKKERKKWRTLHLIFRPEKAPWQAAPLFYWKRSTVWRSFSPELRAKSRG